MESGNRSVTATVRERWSGPLVIDPHEHADSGPVTPEIAERVLAEGLADAVCMGGGDEGYIDYPTLQFRVPSSASFVAAD